jgi:hypothetical protein
VGLVSFLKGQPEPNKLEAMLIQFCNKNGFVMASHKDFASLTTKIMLRRNKLACTVVFSDEALADVDPNLLLKKVINSIPVELWLDDPAPGPQKVSGQKPEPSFAEAAKKATAEMDALKKSLAASSKSYILPNDASLTETATYYKAIWEAKGYLNNNPAATYSNTPKTSTFGNHWIVSELSKFFDMTQEVFCPHCNALKSLADVIIDLNDSAGYTREQIADWLEKAQINIKMKEK